MDWKKTLKKIWYFIWEDNSIWSWLVNVILAFVLIKFIIYPGLGLILGTTYPIVAVVSSSMEHPMPYDAWWIIHEDFYDSQDINKEQFLTFPHRNGFNKGDIMFLIGAEAEKVNIGDVIVFQSKRPDPIIHRVVKKWETNGNIYIQTKGDNNRASIKDNTLDETQVTDQQLLGKTLFRVPYLGWIKIGFVCSINSLAGKDSFIDCMRR